MIRIGIPVPYQKPVYDDKAPKNNKQVDIKYNGQRAQVHLALGTEPILFSKNFGQWNPDCFPEIIPELKEFREDIIFDSEMVGSIGGTEGLVAIQRRPKEIVDGQKIRQYPLQLRVFDLLYHNGPLVDLPLAERRERLEELVGKKHNVLVAETRLVSNIEEIAQYYHEVVFRRKEEGVVCKDQATPYLIGKESKKWVKIVEFKTVDLVVGGFYKGEGKESGAPFAAVMLCSYNDETKKYETAVKVGVTGDLRDELAAELLPSLQAEAPENILLNQKLFTKRAFSRKIPFGWINPEKSVVVTVRSKGGVSHSPDSWHSCGGVEHPYSLLIPIIEHIREPCDKKPQDATKTRQIKELYEQQLKKEEE